MQTFWLGGDDGLCIWLFLFPYSILFITLFDIIMYDQLLSCLHLAHFGLGKNRSCFLCYLSIAYDLDRVMLPLLPTKEVVFLGSVSFFLQVAEWGNYGSWMICISILRYYTKISSWCISIHHFGYLSSVYMMIQSIQGLEILYLIQYFGSMMTHSWPLWYLWDHLHFPWCRLLKYLFKDP